MPDRSIVSVLIIFAALLLTIPTYREMIRAEAPSGGAMTSGFHASHPTGAPADHTGPPATLASITIRPGGEVVPHAGPGASHLLIEQAPSTWAVTGGSASALDEAATSADQREPIDPATITPLTAERGW